MRLVSPASASVQNPIPATPGPQDLKDKLTTSLVNIHTHSLGALFYLILLPLHLLPTHFPTWSRQPQSDPLPTPPSWEDKLALTIYLLCAVGCLSLSSWFHTVQCHSKPVCDAAHRGDYVSSARPPQLTPPDPLLAYEFGPLLIGEIDRHCHPYRRVHPTGTILRIPV